MLVERIKLNGAEFRIVRDDLFPTIGGGNKGRKTENIAKAITSEGCNAVVTTGGIQSNHCRAVAIKCAEMGWACKLILHGSSERFYAEGGNAKIIRMTGAMVEFVEPSQISLAMDRGMEDFRANGFIPYYIYGGGHNMKGGEAYVFACDDLQVYCEANSWYPDHIFLASGTGSTQAGILAGLDKNNMKAEVIGISIARPSTAAAKIVEDFYVELKKALNISSPNRNTAVNDNYLAGGYEHYNKDILSIINQVAAATGVFLDPTYSGKAFWGMLNVIKQQDIKGNILFWHTGGLFNLLASNT